MKPSYLLLSFFICILLHKSYAQDKDRILKLNLQQANITYKQPKNFAESDSVEMVPCANGTSINPLDYSLQAKKADIIVGIDIFRYYPPNPIITKISRNAPNAIDPNKNYLRVIELQGDTAKEKVIWYTKEYSKKKFNADAGAQYVLTCNRL